MVEFCFVLAERQNEFFFEIARAIADELEQIGHYATISTTGFPEQRRGLVNVLLPPHEYYALEGIHVEPTWQTLKRTIFICAEQPGTSFFDSDVFLAERAGAVFDVNRDSIDVFRRRGVTGVQHFPLGWTRTWSHVDLSDSEPPQPRDIDILHLGIMSPRREVMLSSMARLIEPWRAQLILSDDHRSNREEQQNFATGERKWDLLSRARVLLNLHVAERPYFEWQRVIQAICNGALVISEHSEGYCPLIPGTHFLAGRPQTLALLAQEPLHYEERRLELTRAAWRFIRDELPLGRSVGTLVRVAAEVDQTAPVATRSERFPLPSSALRSMRMLRGDQTADENQVTGGDAATSQIRSALKDMRLAEIARRREAALVAVAARRTVRPPAVEDVLTTPAYRLASHPEVSVLVALYNHCGHVTQALDSAAASRDADVEIIVVDDGSSDDSEQTVRAWAQHHQDVSLRLRRHPVNRGLGAARNSALDVARGDLCFILDSDNAVYPRGISRLVAAIGADPAAVFSYGILEAFTSKTATGLRSAFPWQPWRLRQGNYIDAMALVRTDWLRANGGYTTDLRLYGWEDYRLWLDVAEQGLHGTFTAQIIARYRATRHSMLAVTDISSRQAISLLIESHPDTLAGVVPPF